jgi:DNA invertase Pin-like site-specific DNA recombinase
MSSLAQEESRSISENVTWGKRKLMAEGKVYLRYDYLLGYEKEEDVNGNIKTKINETEAEIVREIFTEFLRGKSMREIASNLDLRGIKTKMVKKFNHKQVKRILQNEKYAGNAVLQKTFTVDFLQKKHKKNEGEVQQYIIEGSHPEIIDKKTFLVVQNLYS